MTPCRRGPEPLLLARESAQLGHEYAARRRENPGFRFEWRKSLLEVVREALAAMTAGHCSYCDGHPLRATGLPTVDHFRPKTRPEFYELVCSWTNLFLTCTTCNNAKGEKWDEALLRPDDLDFDFERYFEFRADSGRLEPAAAAPPEDQYRALRTIEILDLNRLDVCKTRRWAVEQMRQTEAIDHVDDWAYRYLIPLCRPI